jgi:S-adenosyl-L-methionine hydrolase (adenosine-forming)
MANSGRIITLLTDFGLRDHFVAAMKGVILGLNPDLTLVDISHLVPPQDIHSGAFLLGQAYSCFPQGTIHLAVVDPAVGTARKVLAATADGNYFVAPDNGILSYVKKNAADFSAYEVTADHYFHKPVSATFHGRDIFAPVAAWISRGIPLHQLGDELADPVLLKIPVPARVREGLIQAAVLAVDHYGNLITNLTLGHLPPFEPAQPLPFKILAGKREITGFRKAYGEGQPEEVFIIQGSSEYIEISMRDGSAAATLGLKIGAPIGVVLS